MGDKNRAEAGSTVRKGEQQDIEAAGNIKRRELYKRAEQQQGI